MNLFLALAAEHRKTSGHDIFNLESLTYINCEVCSFLIAEKREQEKAEAEHNRQLEEEQALDTLRNDEIQP